MGKDIVRQRNRPEDAGGLLGGDTAAIVADLRERLAATLARVLALERVQIAEAADDTEAEQLRLNLDEARTALDNVRRAMTAAEAEILSHAGQIQGLLENLGKLGWEWAVNADAIELEARGAVEVCGRTTTGMVRVRRPTADNLSPGLIRFMGNVALPAGGFSLVACPFMVECKAQYSGAEPSVGDILTTTADSFELAAGDETTAGFVVNGVVTETIGEVEVSRACVLPYTAGGGTAVTEFPVKINLAGDHGQTITVDGKFYTCDVYADGWFAPSTATDQVLYVGAHAEAATLPDGTELMAYERTGDLGDGDVTYYETIIPVWL